MVNVRQELALHTNQAIAHSGTRPAFSMVQQGKQALSAVYIKKQTSEGLVQNKCPRLIDLTEGHQAHCPESGQLGCIKHVG